MHANNDFLYNLDIIKIIYFYIKYKLLRKIFLIKLQHTMLRLS